jgi:hypothetical protein
MKHLERTDFTDVPVDNLVLRKYVDGINNDAVEGEVWYGPNGILVESNAGPLELQTRNVDAKKFEPEEASSDLILDYSIANVGYIEVEGDLDIKLSTDLSMFRPGVNLLSLYFETEEATLTWDSELLPEGFSLPSTGEVGEARHFLLYRPQAESTVQVHELGSASRLAGFPVEISSPTDGDVLTLEEGTLVLKPQAPSAEGSDNPDQLTLPPTIAPDQEEIDPNTLVLFNEAGRLSYASPTDKKWVPPNAFEIKTVEASTTLSVNDIFQRLEFSGTENLELTVPEDTTGTIPIGQSFQLVNPSSHLVEIVPEAGVTIHSSVPLELPGGFHEAVLTKRAAQSWVFSPLTFVKKETRQTVSFSTLPLAVQDKVTVPLAISKSFILITIETSIAARVRVYSKGFYATNDFNRPISEPFPLGLPGLILEAITTPSMLTIPLARVVGCNQESPPTDLLPVTVTNLSTELESIQVDFDYLVLEL